MSAEGRAVGEDLMPSFLEACSATGPIRLDVSDRAGTRTVEPRVFHQPFLLIGRNPEADLVLNHSQVSRNHTYLQVVSGRLLSIDLDSWTGTRRQRGSGPVGWVDPPEAMRIGPFDVMLLSDQPGDPGTPARPAGQSTPLCPEYVPEHPLPRTTLEISGRRMEPTLWPMRRVLTLVGGSPLCRVQVTASGGPRLYCSLLRTPNAVWMVDLSLMPEGVLVNGERRRFARLVDGDELLVGPYTLRLRYDSPPGSRGIQIGRPVPGETTHLGPAPVELGSLKPFVKPEMIRAVPSSSVGYPAPDELLPAVYSLLEQVVQLQQQMAGQLPQAIALITQVVGSLHRDQMTIVQGELEQIRRLNEEIRALRVESALHQPGPGQPASEDTHSARPRPASPRADAKNTTAPISTAQPGFAGGEWAVGTPDGLLIPPRLSTQEVQAIASERLAAFERERRRRWRKLLRGMISS